jgi:hypothetical protein
VQKFWQTSRQWCVRHLDLCIAIGLALAFLIVQLFFLPEFGATWDEPLHRNWGKLFSIFWKTGDRSLLYMMPGNGVYYSPAYFTLSYIVSEFFLSFGLPLYQASHILNLCTASLVVLFLYLLAQLLTNRRTALFATLFLLGFPQFLAHAHYNPKDIPLMLSVLMTSYVFLRSLSLRSTRLLLLSAFLFGASIAMKVSAILMVPVFLVTYVVSALPQFRISPMKRFFERQLVLVLASTLLLIIGAVVFWPSAWGDLHLIPSSIAFFLGHSFWPGRELFMGTLYAGADLPWYYTSLVYLQSTPVLTILFFIIGAVILLRKNRSLLSSQVVFLALWILVPLLASLKPGLVRYDGIRQFFFVLPPILIIASIGFDRILSWILTWGMPRWVSVIFVSFVVLSLTHEVISLHPFEGSYRNEVVRLMNPVDMDRRYEIEYWGASYKQGLDWLQDNAEPNAEVCVPVAGLLISWYEPRPDLTFNCSRQTSYVMFFTRYSELKQATFDQMTPIMTIERMGASLLKIYKIR